MRSWMVLAACLLAPANLAADDPGGRRKVFRGWPVLRIEEGPGEEDRAVDAFFSLYHSSWRGDARYFHLAPFYFDEVDEAGRRWSLFAPFYYYSSDADGWTFASALLTARDDAGVFSLGAPAIPLYRLTHSPWSRSDRLGLWLLGDVFARRANDHEGSVIEVLALLPWGEPGDALLPFLRHREDAAGVVRESAAYPFYRYRFDDATDHSWWALAGLARRGRRVDRTWFAVEPFYSEKRHATGGSRSWLRVYGREWDVAAGLDAVGVLEPLGRFEWTRDSDSQSHRHRFFPFYFAGGREDVLGASSYLTLAPFYHRSDAPERRRRIVFPFYWAAEHGDDEYQLLAPLFFRAAGPDHSHVWVPPLWGRYRRDLEGGGRLTRSFFALGAVFREEEIGPAGEPGRSAVHLLGPLAGASRDPQAMTTHSRLLPFFFRSAGPGYTSLWVLPFWGRQQRDLEWGGRLTTSFFALGTVLDEREVGPGGDDGRTATHVLGPLAGVSSDPQTMTTHSRLLPFWWHTREPGQRFLHSFGVFSTRVHDDGRFATRLTPFVYWARGEGDGLWSRLHLVSHRQGEETERTQVFPYVHEKGPESRRRHSFLWPLFSLERDDGFLSLSSLPFGSYRSEPDGEVRHRLSFLHRHRRAPPAEPVSGTWSRDGYLGLGLVRTAVGDETRTVAVNPFLFGYHRDAARDVREWNGLCSLVRYHRDPRRTRFSALAVVNGAFDDRREWWNVFPLAHSDSRKEGTLPRFGWPQLFHVLSRADDADETRWSLFGFLARWKRGTSGDFRFRILHRLVHFGREGTYRERVVEPFFTWEEDRSNGHRYLSVGKFLYRATRHDTASPVKRYVLGVPVSW